MGIPVGAALLFKMQMKPPRTPGGRKVQNEQGAKDVALSGLTGINGVKTFTMKGTQNAIKEISQIAQRDFSVRISALDIYTKRVKDSLNAEADNVKPLDGPEPIPSTSRKGKRSLTERQPGRKDKRAKKDKRRKRKRQKKEKNVDIDNSNDDRPVEGKKKALLIAIGSGMLKVMKPNLQKLMRILPLYGFTDMTVLTDIDESYPDPTEVAIEREAQDIVTNASKGDVILLYYHGHTTPKPPRIKTSDDKYIRAGFLWSKVCQSVPSGVTLYLMLNCCQAFTHLPFWERKKKNHKGGEVVIFTASGSNKIRVGEYMHALAPILREKHGTPTSNQDLHDEVEVKMWSYFIHRKLPIDPKPEDLESPDPRLITSGKMGRKPTFSSMYEDDV